MLALLRSHLSFSEMVQHPAWAPTAHGIAIVEVTSKGNLDPNAHLRDRDIHGFEELVNGGLSQLGHACIQYSSLLCFRRFGPGQAGTLIFGLR